MCSSLHHIKNQQRLNTLVYEGDALCFIHVLQLVFKSLIILCRVKKNRNRTLVYEGDAIVTLYTILAHLNGRSVFVVSHECVLFASVFQSM